MIVATMVALAIMPSAPELGTREGRCHVGETGPAVLVDALGLRDRRGLLRLELYPANDDDFLADDNVLLAAGKSFARVDVPPPASGPARLCIRVPHPGTYALVLLHDRNANHRLDLSGDGIGFAGNPRLGWSRPRAARASVIAGKGMTRIEIRLNYRRGLAMRPLDAP
jgi:uncharacterized protein (DUF2141 family)